MNNAPIGLIMKYLFDYSWIWLPVVLTVVFIESWMYYIRRVYWQGLDWIVLEIKPPKDSERSPKIMEQVFAGLWGIFGTVATKYEKYIKGKIQDYMSFEIVGLNGEIHFLIRTLSKYRNLVESQIYSQYPQAEIREVEDYVNNVPSDIPNKNWDLWGCRLKLVKDERYPIRTYMQQMDIVTGKSVPQFIDPLAGLMEVMGKLRPGEQIWIQIVCRPIADSWADKSIGKKGLVAELMAKARPVASPEGVVAPMALLSPGEREIISLVEQKAAKKAFETKVQFAYIGRREFFSMPTVGATMGLFNQFAALNTNGLKPDSVTTTKANYLFAKQRKIFKQRRMLRLLKTRSFWEQGYILNIEELASLFHFPTIAVKGPMTPWLEKRTAEPPIGLPIA